VSQVPGESLTRGNSVAPEMENPMNENQGRPDVGAPLEQTLPECPQPGKTLSPLGWSIKIRLLWAAIASALLWLAVAWAIGWRW